MVSSEAPMFKEEGNVIVIEDDNYEEVVAAYPKLLIEFYAPWCGHCKSLAPEYESAATTLLAQDPPIRIAKVDATAATKFAELYDIKGFPTLKLFSGSLEKDSIADYDGGRTADEIVKWMNKKSGPSVTIVTTDAELQALKEANEVIVVAYVADVDGADRVTFEKIASTDDSAVYVVIAEASLLTAAGKTAPALSLFKQFDEGENHLPAGEFASAAIKTFVSSHAKPLIMVFSQEKASQIFGGDLETHLLVFSDETAEYHEKLTTAMKIPATSNKGKVLHVVIPLTEDRILDYFGFSAADLPTVMLVNMKGGMKKFAFGKTTAEILATMETTLGADLEIFEASYLAGDLTPALKSADPVDDSGDAVKVMTGGEFKARVIDSDKDVLLEFYAPWCGHCKSLAPLYDELAEKFSSVSSIMIAKMDATENEIDHPGVNVEGFPTIIFFPGGDKAHPVVYDGKRDVEGFTKYLKEHAKTFELDGETHGSAHDEL